MGVKVITSWEVGDTFVGIGGGWVWQVIEVMEVFDRVRAKCLANGAERIFWFDQIEPAIQ